jgi:hypothetical protein
VTEMGSKEGPVHRGACRLLPLSEASAPRPRTALPRTALWQHRVSRIGGPGSAVTVWTTARQSVLDKDTALLRQMAYSLNTMDSLAKLRVHSSTPSFIYICNFLLGWRVLWVAILSFRNGERRTRLGSRGHLDAAAAATGSSATTVPLPPHLALRSDSAGECAD